MTMTSNVCGLVLLLLCVVLRLAVVEAISGDVSAVSSIPERKEVEVAVDRLPRRSGTLQELSTWATQQGVWMHEDLKWKEFVEDDNWGLQLEKPVPKGTVLLKVPRSLALDANVIQHEMIQEFGADIISKVTTNLDQFATHIEGFWIFYKLLKLSLFITDIEDADNNVHQRWRPWIRSLPTKYIQFSKEEKECLPFYARHIVQYHERKFEAFYKTVCEMLPGLIANKDHARWAFDAVNSRFWKAVDNNNVSTDIDDEDGSNDPSSVSTTSSSSAPSSSSELVPVGDMFNHREPPNVAITHSDDGYINFIYKGDDDDDNANCLDLFITYGQPSNPHRFLSTFGFIPTEQDMPKVWSHIAYPNNPFCGPEDVENMVFHVKNGYIPTIVWDAVLFSLLQPSDSTTRIYYTKEQHTKYRKYTLPVLKTHIENQIKELEELRTKIESMDTTTAIKDSNLPLIRQHNAFLTTAFTRVQEYLEKGNFDD